MAFSLSLAKRLFLPSRTVVLAEGAGALPVRHERCTRITRTRPGKKPYNSVDTLLTHCVDCLHYEPCGSSSRNARSSNPAHAAHWSRAWACDSQTYSTYVGGTAVGRNRIAVSGAASARSEGMGQSILGTLRQRKACALLSPDSCRKKASLQ